MYRIARAALLVLTPLLSLGLGHAPALAAPETHAEMDPQVQVVGSAFLVAHVRADGSMEFKPEKVVPLTEGQTYGWAIAIKTARKQVRWREEFTLPAAPQSWGVPEPLGKRKLVDEERTSVTERVVTPINGQIFNFWDVLKGDPPGPYKIRVFIEDRLVASFEFELR